MQITHLTQRINFQNAELEKYHTMNFELHINQESLQTQCKDLKHQKDNLKRNMTELMKKLSEQSETLQISEKRLAVKVSEMIGRFIDCSWISNGTFEVVLFLLALKWRNIQKVF